MGIGANSTIIGAIIGERVCITNKDRGVEADEANYHIRDGIVVVPKDAVIPSGTVV